MIEYIFFSISAVAGLFTIHYLYEFFKPRHYSNHSFECLEAYRKGMENA